MTLKSEFYLIIGYLKRSILLDKVKANVFEVAWLFFYKLLFHCPWEACTLEISCVELGKYQKK